MTQLFRLLCSGRLTLLSDLLDELKMAREKNMETFYRLRKAFTMVRVLIIDRRHSHQSTIIVSQYEPVEWLDQIPIPVAARL